VAGPLTAPSAPEPPGSRPLPPLREDVTLIPGPRALDGSPTWTIVDPAAGRFVRVGRLEFEIVARWPLGTADKIAESLRRDTTLSATAEDVLSFVAFAERAELLFPAGAAAVKRLVDRAAARRSGAAKWLLKNYLFIRVPLINPDPFLDATVHLVRPLYSLAFLRLLIVGAALGLFLIGRQWDAFLHAFPRLLTLEGLVIGGGALLTAKIAHEFGHAYAAKIAGCRVPSMGGALMVMIPMLWTDTTDAWRLTSRRERLMIDAGGLAAEFALTVFAALAWSVLPDGPLRSAAFTQAGVSWILSLTVNLSPFMRFDGYYLLADALDMPNLQERAFALTRWRLRETLFGFGDPPPEEFPRSRHMLLVLYSFATWMYRFILFLGIAVLVYHAFFKALGILLWIVEMGWFIVRPIAGEIGSWAKRGRRHRWNARSIATLASTAALIAALVVPWRSEVALPAVFRAERQTDLLSIEPGRIVSMPDRNGREVAAGETLFVLDSPDLRFKIAQAGREAARLRAQVASDSVDPEALSRLSVTLSELEGAVADQRALEARARDLVIRAPFAGRVMEIPEYLRPGAWVAKREPLASLADMTTTTIEAYVSEADSARPKLGAEARFFPDDLGPPISATLETIDPTAVKELRRPDLASAHGGPIPTRTDGKERLIPEDAIYRVILRPTASFADERERRGVVHVVAERSSPAARVWRSIRGLLIRESGW